MDAAKTGAYLASLRKTHGLTQQGAAEALHLSNKTVSKWENGAGLPDIAVLPALAELYGVTADEILAGESQNKEIEDEATVAPQTPEIRKYLLNRAMIRFELWGIVALGCDLFGSFVLIDYFWRVAQVLFPLVMLGAFVTMRPTAAALPEIEQCSFWRRALRMTLPLILLWEWGLQKTWLASAAYAVRLHFGVNDQVNWLFGAPFLLFSILAVLTMLILQMLSHRLCGREHWLLPAWLTVLYIGSLAAISAAQIRYWALYPCWQTLKTIPETTQDSLSKLQRLGCEKKLAELSPPYNWALALIVAGTGVLALFLLYRKMKKKRETLAKRAEK